jgi:hypothetical protein
LEVAESLMYISITASPTSTIGTQGICGGASCGGSSTSRAAASRCRYSDGPTLSAMTSPTSAMIPRFGPSDRCSRPAPALAREPRMPPMLHAPWKETRMLRPYRCWTATPCMFMVASTAPRNSPKAATAAYSTGRVGAKPTAVIVAHTAGPETRSTTALPNRGASAPARRLPTPATTGTTSRISSRALSLKPKFFCSVGTRVTSAAKHSPWTK